MKMRRNKYNARRVTVDGHTFDSAKEAERYKELKLLEHIGKIKGLVLQPRYTLQEAFRYKGKTIRKIEYVADFSYIYNGKIIVEDVKGVKTDVYKLKKKLFLRLYGEEFEHTET